MLDIIIIDKIIITKYKPVTGILVLRMIWVMYKLEIIIDDATIEDTKILIFNFLLILVNKSYLAFLTIS